MGILRETTVTQRVLGLLIFCAFCVSLNALCRYAHDQISAVCYLGTHGVVMQSGSTDCGCAALQMVFRTFGIEADYKDLTAELGTADMGTSMLHLKQVARRHGLSCEGWRLTLKDLRSIPLPAILFLRRNHFVVLASYTPTGGFILLDPSRGRLQIAEHRLGSIWGGQALLFHKPGIPFASKSHWFGGSPISERTKP